MPTEQELNARIVQLCNLIVRLEQIYELFETNYKNIEEDFRNAFLNWFS